MIPLSEYLSAPPVMVNVLPELVCNTCTLEVSPSIVKNYTFIPDHKQR